MVKKIIDRGNPDLHAEKRDTKLRKKHHLPDNRKSIQLIARLSVTRKRGKKSSPRQKWYNQQLSSRCRSNPSFVQGASEDYRSNTLRGFSREVNINL